MWKFSPLYELQKSQFWSFPGDSVKKRAIYYAITLLTQRHVSSESPSVDYPTPWAFNPFSMQSQATLSPWTTCERVIKTVVHVSPQWFIFRNAPSRPARSRFRRETVKICDGCPLSVNLISPSSSLPPRIGDHPQTHTGGLLFTKSNSCCAFPRNLFSQKYVCFFLCLSCNTYPDPVFQSTHMCSRGLRLRLVKGIRVVAEKKARAHCHEEIRFTGKSWWTWKNETRLPDGGNLDERKKGTENETIARRKAKRL